MTTADDKLQAWLGRMRRAASLELRSGRRMIGSWDRSQHEDDAALAADITQQATEDADDVSGVSRYELAALMPSGRVIGTTRWTVYGGKSADADDDLEESSAGLLRQNQRHLEATQRLLVYGAREANEQIASAAKAIIEQQNETIKELRARVGTLEARETEMIRLHEDLRSKQHERDMARAEALANAELKREALGEVKHLIPVVTNAAARRLLGPGAVPVPDMPDALESLVLSIKPEQIEALQAIFTPAQVVAFLATYKQITDRAQEREAKKQNGAAAPSPEPS